MCPGARVAALSSVLQYLAQEKLSALVLRIFEELLGLIILDDLVRVDKEYPLKCIVQAVDGQCNRDLERDIATVADDLGGDLDQLLAQRGQPPALHILG